MRYSSIAAVYGEKPTDVRAAEPDGLRDRRRESGVVVVSGVDGGGGVEYKGRAVETIRSGTCALFRRCINKQIKEESKKKKKPFFPLQKPFSVRIAIIAIPRDLRAVRASR